jgi:hypothetical protein
MADPVLVEVPCVCRGGNPTCQQCGGTGNARKVACKTCGGTTKHGGQRCPDCRGVGWREIDQTSFVSGETDREF